MSESSDQLLIQGFGLGGYKSFAQEVQWLDPLSRVNIIIGENNVGKSNLLRFIIEKFSDATANALREGISPFDDDDRNKVLENSRVGLGVLALAQNPLAYRSGTHDHLERVFAALRRNGEPFRVRFFEDSGSLKVEQELVYSLESIVSPEEWELLAGNLTSVSSNLTESNIRSVVRQVLKVSWTEPKRIFIPAVRECNRPLADNLPFDKRIVFDGNNLGNLIGEHHSPARDVDTILRLFRKFERFVQFILQREDVEVSVPRGETFIQVRYNNRTWRLEELGTGIHEIVLFAAAAVLHSKALICIEEPEIHVHPSWQRRLIELLLETDNQYFIATHSAHIMDLPGVSVFRLESTPSGTVINKAVSPAEKSEICAALGYRPSDLYQSNCIIWVEGPSDRVYVKHWIEQADSRLIEGVHYSLMFYGGALGAHLTAEDLQETEEEEVHDCQLPEPVVDLISLRRLNRHLAIIIDSDKKSDEEQLTPVKCRLKEEFDKGPGFAWITAGRSIENYFNEKDVLAVMKKIHPRSDFARDGEDQYSLLAKLKSGDGKKDAKKVEIAHRLINSGVKPRCDLDLEERVSMLVAFIRKASGLV